MWYEALPSICAMFTTMTIIELGPAITHYISWGCPMKRNSANTMQHLLQRRDQRIATDNGVPWWAKHMYTYSFSALEEPVKLSGNVEHYKRAEETLGGATN